ncbi:MAG TPA: hypothetical protein VMF56_09225 [Acidobacteriaceae bacterium]|nr:hypothetical protein [Acidobacteriaceae bacterium]
MRTFRPAGKDGTNLRAVAPADFQAAATQEGAQGRVITAASYDKSGNVYYIFYGWQSDPSTVYETTVYTRNAAENHSFSITQVRPASMTVGTVSITRFPTAASLN